ncbi:MAG TPA: 2-C-methyl-D-erythritol 4-phosphate cytidylyltransferase [Anaerovoracaceae bacterium]|nr:2-C-methyl-D-erythritol 4-phosphate cytidylyltransferase [Anaerovoracaceae bacterium]
MYNDKKITVIIAAAGSGKRMGGGIPKQYLSIGSMPILIKTVKAFETNAFIDTILVVTNVEYMNFFKDELTRFGIENIDVVAGGDQRQDSVYNGLKAMPKDTDYVIIHDGARPFVSKTIIADTLDAVLEKKAVVTAVPVKDTITRQVLSKKKPFAHEKSFAGLEYFDRNSILAVQTPQAFEKKLIMKAYKLAYKDGFYGTDEGMLVERLGHPVHIVNGAYLNIKITTKEDLPMENRIGSGYDVHRLTAGRKLILGGINIPFEKGLLGHSDADVLVHAIMDALLGAAALGDIGKHFPEDKDEFKDISSMVLLKRVHKILLSEGYNISNIDATIICQQPKISPYIGDMITNIGEVLGIAENRISIKATTTEKLGFTGREEGIAAEAVCLLNK